MRYSEEAYWDTIAGEIIDTAAEEAATLEDEMYWDTVYDTLITA